MPLRRASFLSAFVLLLLACGTTSTSAPDSGLAAGQCRVSNDCTPLGNSYFCGVLVLPPMCGGLCEAASTSTCQADTDCADAGTGTICSGPTSRGPCFCGHGGAIPQPACAKGCASASDCGPGQACSPTHRCIAATCAQPSECGSGNLTCTNDQCTAKSCVKDADCANFCVMGACSAALGGCAQAVP